MTQPAKVNVNQTTLALSSLPANPNYSEVDGLYSMLIGGSKVGLANFRQAVVTNPQLAAAVIGRFLRENLVDQDDKTLNLDSKLALIAGWLKGGGEPTLTPAQVTSVLALLPRTEQAGILAKFQAGDFADQTNRALRPSGGSDLKLGTSLSTSENIGSPAKLYQLAPNLISGQSGVSAPATQSVTSTQAIDDQIKNMSPEQKVALLFSPEIGSTSPAQQSPGFYTLYGWNITNQPPADVAARVSAQRSASSNVLDQPIFNVDYEGGWVSRRVTGATNLGDAMELGAISDPAKRYQLAYERGQMMGSDLYNLGITLNLAPVADTYLLDGSFLESRCFGSDPQAVADITAGTIAGFHQSGVACVVKHFPGHGSTTGDSHASGLNVGIPAGTPNLVVAGSKDELINGPLLPFQTAINAGVDGILVGHIAVPALDGTIIERTDDQGVVHKYYTPASLSQPIITGLLRGEMGFNGVVMSDELGMGALGFLPLGERAVSFIQAGGDLICLKDGDPAEAQTAILQAVKDGRISQDRLDQSVRRILTLRQNHGQATQPSDPAAAFTPAAQASHQDTSREIAEASITLVSDASGHDLSSLAKTGQRVSVCDIIDVGDLSTNIETNWRAAGGAADKLQIMTDRSVSACTGDIVIISDSPRNSEATKKFVDGLLAKGKKVIIIATGAPHYIDRYPADKVTIICTYSLSIQSMDVAADLLFGQVTPSGQLSIDVHDDSGKVIYARGFGLKPAPSKPRSQAGNIDSPAAYTDLLTQGSRYAYSHTSTGLLAPVGLGGTPNPADPDFDPNHNFILEKGEDGYVKKYDQEGANGQPGPDGIITEGEYFRSYLAVEDIGKKEKPVPAELQEAVGQDLIAAAGSYDFPHSIAFQEYKALIKADPSLGPKYFQNLATKFKEKGYTSEAGFMMAAIIETGAPATSSTTRRADYLAQAIELYHAGQHEAAYAIFLALLRTEKNPIKAREQILFMENIAKLSGQPGRAFADVCAAKGKEEAKNTYLFFYASSEYAYNDEKFLAVSDQIAGNLLANYSLSFSELANLSLYLPDSSPNFTNVKDQILASYRARGKFDLAKLLPDLNNYQGPAQRLAVWTYFAENLSNISDSDFAQQVESFPPPPSDFESLTVAIKDRFRRQILEPLAKQDGGYDKIKLYLNSKNFLLKTETAQYLVENINMVPADDFETLGLLAEQTSGNQYGREQIENRLTVHLDSLAAQGNYSAIIQIALDTRLNSVLKSKAASYLNALLANPATTEKVQTALLSLDFSQLKQLDKVVKYSSRDLPELTAVLAQNIYNQLRARPNLNYVSLKQELLGNDNPPAFDRAVWAIIDEDLNKIPKEQLLELTNEGFDLNHPEMTDKLRNRLIRFYIPNAPAALAILRAGKGDPRYDHYLLRSAAAEYLCNHLDAINNLTDLELIRQNLSDRSERNEKLEARIKIIYFQKDVKPLADKGDVAGILKLVKESPDYMVKVAAAEWLVDNALAKITDPADLSSFYGLMLSNSGKLSKIEKRMSELVIKPHQGDYQAIYTLASDPSASHLLRVVASKYFAANAAKIDDITILNFAYDTLSGLSLDYEAGKLYAGMAKALAKTGASDLASLTALTQPGQPFSQGLARQVVCDLLLKNHLTEFPLTAEGLAQLDQTWQSASDAVKNDSQVEVEDQAMAYVRSLPKNEWDVLAALDNNNTLLGRAAAAVKLEDDLTAARTPDEIRGILKKNSNQWSICRRVASRVLVSKFDLLLPQNQADRSSLERLEQDRYMLNEFSYNQTLLGQQLIGRFFAKYMASVKDIFTNTSQEQLPQRLAQLRKDLTILRSVECGDQFTNIYATLGDRLERVTRALIMRGLKEKKWADLKNDQDLTGQFLAFGLEAGFVTPEGTVGEFVDDLGDAQFAREFMKSRYDESGVGSILGKAKEKVGRKLGLGSSGDKAAFTASPERYSRKTIPNTEYPGLRVEEIYYRNDEGEQELIAKEVSFDPTDPACGVQPMLYAADIRKDHVDAHVTELERTEHPCFMTTAMPTGDGGRMPTDAFGINGRVINPVFSKHDGIVFIMADGQVIVRDITDVWLDDQDVTLADGTTVKNMDFEQTFLYNGQKVTAFYQVGLLLDDGETVADSAISTNRTVLAARNDGRVGIIITHIPASFGDAARFASNLGYDWAVNHDTGGYDFSVVKNIHSSNPHDDIRLSKNFTGAGSSIFVLKLKPQI